MIMPVTFYLLLFSSASSTTEINLCGWVGSDCSQFIMSHSLLAQSLFDVLEAEPRKRSYAFGEKGRPRPQIRRRSRSARPHSARSVLKVEVPRYYLRGSGLNSYHIFEVKVSWCKVYRETAKQNYSWCYTVCTTIFCLIQIQLGNHRWSVYRRYSEFQQFHEEVKENYPQVRTAVNVNVF